MPGQKKPEAPRAEANWGPLTELGKADTIILGTGILLVILLVYTIREVISPFIVVGSIVFVLYPLRWYPLARNFMWLSVFLFLLWFVYSIAGILAPFAVALLLAYLLHPFITWLEKYRIPRWLSSIVVILLGIAILSVAALLVVPIAVEQFSAILDTASVIANDFTNWMFSNRVEVSLRRYGVSTQQLRDLLTTSFAPRLEVIMKGLLIGAFGLLSGLSTVVSRIVNMVIIPFLTFYVLKDFPAIRHRVKMLLPRSKRERASVTYHSVDALLGRYIRGAIAVAAINAVLVTLFFTLFGIEYPLVLGIVAGVLDLIPYFGLVIMLVLSVIVASFSPSLVFGHMLLAALTIGALHIFEAAVLSPKIIGAQVGIHPVLLIMSLLVFSFFLGFIGLLIAVPTTAIAIMLIKEWEAEKKNAPKITPILENPAAPVENE
ncbi:MAG TPA: AI-2E family transporter [Bacteroidota bacterium]|nr:AI-2E family transporter [Bacteroidota bacterium]